MDANESPTPRRPSKVSASLNRDDAAAAALRTILKELFEATAANEYGTAKSLGMEFLHDFRVSIRRARSALDIAEGILSPRKISPIIKKFSWMGKATGPVRDLDVFLLFIRNWIEKLPPKRAQSLEPFLAFLESERKREQKKLVRSLESARYQKFKKEWNDFLSANENKIAGPIGLETIGSIADRQILKTMRQTLQEGSAISADSPPEKLHKLRKTCKKLRYLMEFFRSLYPKKDISRFIKTLKGLQDCLGEFQDLAVQAGALLNHVKEMSKKETVPAETLMELGRLEESLSRKSARVRLKFEEKFTAFKSNSNFKLVIKKTVGEKKAPRKNSRGKHDKEQRKDQSDF